MFDFPIFHEYILIIIIEPQGNFNLMLILMFMIFGFDTFKFEEFADFK